MSLRKSLQNLQKNAFFRRHNHTIITSKLFYTEYGDPMKVIQKLDEKRSDNLKPQEVLIKMLAAPVNPADINTIQGKYPVKPVLPSVPGNEGVGEVVAIGTEVKSVSVGDRVVLLTNALGTWRSHVQTFQEDVYKIPKKLGLVEAATLMVNPCTAYRMMRDFCALKSGDSLLQNGANSAVGQNVIQIARVWGLKTINIVRNRENISDLKAYLKNLGATYTLTEEELRTTDLFKSGGVRKPRLGLNCVGGKSSLELIRHLDKGATLVTYGGMSREPVTIPTGPLIFKDLRLRGFWMTEWSKKHRTSVERKEMLEELISMMTSGEMHGPASQMIPFDNYRDALLNTMSVKGMAGKKFILKF